MGDSAYSFSLEEDYGSVTESASDETLLFSNNGWNSRKVIIPPTPSFLDTSRKLWLMPNPLVSCSKTLATFDAGEPTIEWCPERKFLLKIPTDEGLYMGELMRSDYFYQQHVIKSSVPNRDLVQSLLLEARRCIKLHVRRLRVRLHDEHEEEKKRLEALEIKDPEAAGIEDDFDSDSEWLEAPSSLNAEVATITQALAKSNPASQGDPDHFVESLMD